MSNSKKIIISSFSDCRQKNGVVTFMNIFKDSLEYFSDRGFDVCFSNYIEREDILSAADKSKNLPLNTEVNRNGLCVLTIKQINKSLIKSTLISTPLGSFFVLTLTLARKGLFVALKAKRKESAPCVHFYQDLFSAYFGALLHSKKSKKIFILHTSGDPLYMLFDQFPALVGTRYEKWIASALTYAIKAQDSVITLSEDFAKRLENAYPGGDFRCIYNTTPFSGDAKRALNIVNASDKIKFIAVGSLIKRKGFDLLIDAIVGLDQSFKNRIHLKIIGEGPERSRLQNKILESGLAEVINLYGTSDSIYDHLLESDVFVLTSRDEGLPIALIEAAGLSLPIITTRVGSIPEIFDEDKCIYVDKKSDSIKKGIEKVVSGDVDLTVLAKASAAIFSEKLSKKTFLESYCNLFKSKFS